MHTGIDGVNTAIARVSGDAGLLIFLKGFAIREEPGPMLHHHTSGLEAAGHEWEVADRGGNPFLTYVIPHRGFGHRDLAKQGVVMESKDYIKGAVRAHLDAPLPYLINDIKVMPVKQGCDLAHLGLVELPLARDWGVPSGACDRGAAVRVPAIPDDPPSPGLKHFLPKDSGGNRRRVGAGRVPALMEAAAVSANASQVITCSE